MTSPPQEITVECPRCRTRFRDWYRPSINLGLGEEWSEEYLREATTTTCPSCGLMIELGALVVEREGDVWNVEARDDRGGRVELVATSDRYTLLPPGARGDGRPDR